MKKIAYFISLFVLAGILVVACKSDDKDDLPPEETQTHTVTGFTPPNGPVGTEVTITGTNLTTQDASAAIGGTTAAITGANSSGTELYITVPNGASDGKISVTIGDVEKKSTNDFVVTEETSGPDAIELAVTSLEMRTLDIGQFPEITNLDEFENPTISYESDSESTLEVDEEGVLKALQSGEATLEVTVVSNEVEFTAEVMVNISPSEFVVGSENNGFYDYIKVWKNGEVLYSINNDGNDAYGQSIFVSNSNYIYVTGHIIEPNLSRVSKVWRNGEEVMVLEEGEPFDVLAVDIHVTDNEELYVAGSKHSGQSYEAAYWHNGDATVLHNGPSSASDLILYEQDVYTVGDVGNSASTVWLNENELYTLPKSDESYSLSANSITVLDGLVYTAGVEFFDGYFKANVWENGNLHLSLYDNVNSSSARSLVATADNLYIVGEEGFRATLWINTKSIPLATVTSEATEIKIHDGFAYISGKRKVESKDAAVVWKVNLDNEEIETIELDGPLGTKNYRAASLFIK
ncbi:IPT/TIG domain-containing protein [Flagellimonas sp.]|uniref:IPT/TIG domain-containing protein n=1 Tax=Flagellimonas sp. TaxID=2058762 RepID=UPI003B51FD26